MAELQFDTEQEYARRYESAEPPLFIRYVLATGLVKDTKTAQYVLLGVIVVAILLAFYLFSSSGSGAQPSSKTDIQRFTELQRDAHPPQ